MNEEISIEVATVSRYRGWMHGETEKDARSRGRDLALCRVPVN
jgi:hypothetical protein